MLRRLAFFAIAASALGGCASYDPARDARGWFFNTDGEVKLAYGTPQSDDVALMITCTAGSGQVTFSQGGLKPEQGIAVASDGHSATFRGPTQEDQLNGGLLMEAEAALTHAVEQGWRDKGELRLVETGQRGPMLPTPAEGAMIGQCYDRGDPD